jgi:uncharacterized repeat protein (TIGR03806 family)
MGDGGDIGHSAGEAGQGGQGSDPVDRCTAVECPKNARCVDEFGRAHCECLSGYEPVGPGDSKCEDVNECATGKHNCDATATCSNVGGGFVCVCPTALDSDGRSCFPYAHGLDTRPTNSSCAATATSAPDATALSFVDVFPGVPLSWPVAMAQLSPAAGSGFVVAEQDGFVRYFENAPDAEGSMLVVDLSQHVNANLPDQKTLSRLVNWELGLLGVAFSPSFPEVPDFYVAYTRNAGTPQVPSWALRLSRLRWFGTPANADDEQVLLEVILPGPHHHGGSLGFDPTGHLMMGIGEGDVSSNSQLLDTLLGKLLRLDISGADPIRGTPYRIPSDNPFANGGGAPEIWAYGLRNPWKWSFDRETDELWLGDVGANLYEEVNIIQKGKNYGWPLWEGPQCHGSPDACANETLAHPYFSYYHDRYPHSGGGNAIVGGYVYRGHEISDIRGTYIYADSEQGLVVGMHDAGGVLQAAILGQLNWGISSLAEGDDGELFVLPYAQDSRALKITKSAPATGGPPPLLSLTGCVDPANPKAPAAGTIPYEINVPFWSDGAKKERWFSVPAGLTIGVDDRGDWQFPVGSVLVKTFERNGRMIETRLLMHHEDGWAGYSYEWNDEQTDAALLSLGKTTTLADGTWTFPSRADCRVCHTTAAGFTLGLQTAQLNRLAHYPESQREAHQLSSLEHIGLFDRSVSDALPSLVPLDATGASLDARARSYLHANCSYCHRPDGSTGLDMDFRFDAAFDAMGLSDVAPQRGDLGILDARRLKPGSPAQSVLFHRLDRVGAAQMPPLARNRIDLDGVAVIDEWITSLVSCPPSN